MQFALNPPQNWQDFEDLCHALWEREWNCPTIQRNGRSGQSQRGVDIFGRPNGGEKYHGIQCKLKSIDAAGPLLLTRAEIEHEITEARQFIPPLQHLIIATTAPADATIQTFVRELSERHAQMGLFKIDVFAWPEIKIRLVKHETILERFYPGASTGVKRIAEQLAALADHVAREKGVPAAPLRALLDKFDETYASNHEVFARLDAATNELVELREHLAKLTNDQPELVAIRRKALALIDQGELDRARTVLKQGREAASALRQKANRNDAELLSDEARIDHLQLAYRAAAAKYAKAAELVASFDSEGEWGFLMLQASALFDEGHEFGDNQALKEAIEIYELALAIVPRALRPLDWGLTCNFLGSTLQALGARESGTKRLLEATAAHRQALLECTRERVPLDWAMIQNSLGNALSRLGEREGGTEKLEQAVVAYREALLERTREREPLDWAMTQNNLGSTLHCLGERESTTARLEEAVAAHRQALLEYTRDCVPLDWAMTQGNLGNALLSLGERESGTERIEQAIAAFRDALLEHTRERVPLDWAMTQNSLGNALFVLSERKSSRDHLEQAVVAYRGALLEHTRERVPLDWAMTQNNLGNALSRLGQRDSGTERLEEAIAAYRHALLECTRERVPLDWAATMNNLGNALMLLGDREGGTTRLEGAVAAYRDALTERTREHAPVDWAATQNNLGNVLMMLGKLESGSVRFVEAIAAYREALSERTHESAPLDWATTQNNLEDALRMLSERERDVRT